MQRFYVLAPQPVVGYGGVSHIDLNREDKRPATVWYTPEPVDGTTLLCLELGGVL